MPNLTPTAGWDAVPQLQTLTKVLGGAGGPSNAQGQALLNRTELLRLASPVSAAQFGKSGGNTIANLVGIAPTDNNVIYNAVSYYNGFGVAAAPAYGGGLFVWSVSTPKSAHNGGTVISPTVPWDGSQVNLQDFLNGIGETQPSGFGCWLRIETGVITPEMFGAVGSGLVNDQPACQGALNHVGENGSGEVLAAKRYYIATNLIVPFNVALKGEGQVGHGQQGVGPLPYNFSFDSVSSLFIIESTASIVPQNAAELKDFTCIRAGLVTPFANNTMAQAQVDAFAGTAIKPDSSVATVIGRDVRIVDISCFGFEYAVFVEKCPRIHISGIKFDCINGLFIKGVADFSSVQDCHGWPYLTANNNIDQVLFRRNVNVAYYAETSYLTYNNCSHVGWNKGFVANGCQVINFAQCRNDRGPIQRRTFGFKIDSDVYILLPGQEELIGLRAFVIFDRAGAAADIEQDNFFTFGGPAGSEDEFLTVPATTPRTPVFSAATYRKIGGRTIVCTTAAPHGGVNGSYFLFRFGGVTTKIGKIGTRDLTATTFRFTFPETEQAFYDTLPGSSGTNTPFEYELQIVNRTTVTAPSFSGTYSRVDSAFTVTTSGQHTLLAGDKFIGAFYIGATQYYLIFTANTIISPFSLTATPDTPFAVPGTDSGEFFVEPRNTTAFEIGGGSFFPCIDGATGVGFGTFARIELNNGFRDTCIITNSSITDGQILLFKGNLIMQGNQLVARERDLFPAVVQYASPDVETTDGVIAMGNHFDRFSKAFEIDARQLPFAVVGPNKYTECPTGTINPNNNITTGLYSFAAAGTNNQATGESALVSGNAVTASGTNSTAFGSGSIASGATSFAAGGSVTASGTRSVAHGQTTTASGTNSSVLGGLSNSVAVSNSAVVTGTSNTIPAGSNAGIVCGNSNSASSPQSFIGGGSTNTIPAASNNAVVAGGTLNTATGAAASIGGGTSNQALGGNTTIPGGAFATTNNILGQVAFGFNSAVLGASQMSITGLRRTTTDATSQPFTTNGGGAAVTTQLTLRDNTAYRVRGFVVARSLGGDAKEWEVKGLVKRGVGAGTLAFVGTPTVTSTFADAGAATWAVTTQADTTNGAFRLNVSGQAATTINWTGALTAEEVTT